MDMNVSVKSYMRAHCEQSMNLALSAERYTTWEKKCKEVSDVDFIHDGMLRCFSISDSGRHFIQTADESFDIKLTLTNYFLNLKSRRRTDMLEAVEKQSYELNCQAMETAGVDYLTQFPELNDYVVEAADGHFIAHACHTPASPNGITYSAGFIYTLNLRNGLLRPFCCVTNGSKRDHEIPAFRKRVEAWAINNLGVKSLYVYDKAITDYSWWHKQKKNQNYMVSILKDNATYDVVNEIEFDRNDEVNIGIMGCYHCQKGDNTFTIVEYKDPETNIVFKFISTLPANVRPGTIANLYFKRWTIEKGFNNSKSDLKEKKAWAKERRSLNNQMRFTAMSYNLARVIEERTKKEQSHMDDPAVKKYTKELEKRQSKAKEVGLFVNPLHFNARIARICSSTIRSIQSAIYSGRSLAYLIDKITSRFTSKPAT